MLTLSRATVELKSCSGKLWLSSASRNHLTPVDSANLVPVALLSLLVLDLLLCTALLRALVHPVGALPVQTIWLLLLLVQGLGAAIAGRQGTSFLLCPPFLALRQSTLRSTMRNMTPQSQLQIKIRTGPVADCLG